MGAASMIDSESNLRSVVLAVTGASGQIYARWVLKLLVQTGEFRIHVLVSSQARKIVRDELGLESLWSGLPADRLVIEEEGNLESVLASGSYPTAGMMICPCSLNTLGCVAAGISDTLIRRAAQVHLKEHRRLVVGVREMPVGEIDLENMLRLTRVGAVVTPISPPFYHHPAGLDDLADFAAQKLVQLLTGIDGPTRYRPQ